MHREGLLVKLSLICGDLSLISYTERSIVGLTAFLQPIPSCFLTSDKAEDFELSDLFEVFIITFSLLLAFLHDARLILTVFLNLFSL